MNSDKMRKILLVEDSVSDARLLQERIQLSGIQDLAVTVVQSLWAAIEHLKNNHVDASLLDLTLPDSSGLETVRQLRTACPDVPIVVLTGMNDEQTGVEAVRMGVQDYLIKGQADGRLIDRSVRYAIERKRMDNLLRYERQRLETILETIPAAVILVEKPDARITYANRIAAELYGMKPKEGLMLPNLARAIKLLRSNGEIFSPDELPVCRALLQGKTVYNVEVVLQQTGGNRVTLLASAAPLCDPDRNVVAAVGAFGDITERKRMEDALHQLHEKLEQRVQERTVELADAVDTLEKEIRERSKMEKALVQSESKYREIVENVGSIILRRNVDGTITFVNEFAQKFFGFSADKMIGHNIIGTIVPKTDSSDRDMQAFVADISKNLNLCQGEETENICNDGRRVWISWTNRPVRDKSGRVVEILSVGNDVTKFIIRHRP